VQRVTLLVVEEMTAAEKKRSRISPSIRLISSRPRGEERTEIIGEDPVVRIEHAVSGILPVGAQRWSGRSGSRTGTANEESRVGSSSGPSRGRIVAEEVCGRKEKSDKGVTLLKGFDRLLGETTDGRRIGKREQKEEGEERTLHGSLCRKTRTKEGSAELWEHPRR